MIIEYLKETTSYKKNKFFTIFKFNTFALIICMVYFFILPFYLSFYFKQNENIALLFKLFFLFLFLLQVMPLSVCANEIIKKNKTGFFCFFEALKKYFFCSACFAFFKILVFILFINIFRFCLNAENNFLFAAAFIFSFLYFCFEFLTFWFIPIKIEKHINFVSSLKKSAEIFIHHPAFTCFVFFHNLILFFISAILFMTYPGVAKIILNINAAYKLITRHL